MFLEDHGETHTFSLSFSSCLSLFQTQDLLPRIHRQTVLHTLFSLLESLPNSLLCPAHSKPSFQMVPRTFSWQDSLPCPTARTHGALQDLLLQLGSQCLGMSDVEFHIRGELFYRPSDLRARGSYNIRNQTWWEISLLLKYNVPNYNKNNGIEMDRHYLWGEPGLAGDQRAWEPRDSRGEGHGYEFLICRFLSASEECLRRHSFSFLSSLNKIRFITGPGDTTESYAYHLPYFSQAAFNLEGPLSTQKDKQSKRDFVLIDSEQGLSWQSMC